ncbi:MAG: ATP-binding cassette domain-containing protein [Cytophagales bacterium]|nr:ATP-binding cassette domain-containing protein [Cytophagales bacterium]
MAFSTTPVLKAENLLITQQDKPILQHVEFELNKGEFVFLIGRTGSGKSSLLKTLYADLPVSQGKLHAAGYELHNIKRSQIPLLRRKLGIVFQDFQLFQDRSIADNLFFVMKATGWSNKNKMKKRMAEVLMEVGLSSAGEKMPHQLSGGEQQRIGIARALLNFPAILLADEPTGNLDPYFSDEIFEVFRSINNKGTAVIMATHDHYLIKKNPARVLICEGGKLKDTHSSKVELYQPF